MADLGYQPQEQPGLQSVPEKRIKQKTPWWRELLSWVLSIAVAFAAAGVIHTFVFTPVRVDGTSMLGTLHDKEYMIVTKYDYLFHDPDRFDVVICHYPDRGNVSFVKRIVGIPGDTVSISGGVLYVNGEAVEEDYIDYPSYTMAEITVEEGHYFVMGDNRANSNDSRHVGQLERNQINGKVQLVIWPLSGIRTIQ